jgi:sulfonate transport system substrate-binding protein
MMIALAALALLLGGCSAGNSGTGADGKRPALLRIGYQKSSGLLNLLRTRKILETRFGDEVRVEWQEFPAGPQMLEALNVGSVDFGTSGEAPPIFAQAAGAPLLYVALERVGAATEAILVPANSKLRSVADLKGKRIALNKGSNVHYFLVRALEAAGLSYADVDVVFLPPADGRAAFESRNVDAWAIWDPFLTAARAASTARVLVDGNGYVENHQYYFATKKLAESHPNVVLALIEELKQISAWAESHREEIAQFLSDLLGLDLPVMVEVEQRRVYGVEPVAPEIVAYQQAIADRFFQMGLIPREIRVADVIWNSP